MNLKVRGIYLLLHIVIISLLLCKWNADVNGDVFPPDKKKLVKLYKRLDGKNWKNKWEIHSDPCDPPFWYGVACNTAGYIVALNLSSNDLKGPFPTADIFDGLKISRLDLSHNQLTGVVKGIKYLPLLTFADLSHNLLNGDLLPDPDDDEEEEEEKVKAVSNDDDGYEKKMLNHDNNGELLGKSDMENNADYKRRKDALLPKLKYLDMSYNKFNDHLIPDSVWLLQSIEYLSLSHNQLKGSLSDSIRMAENIKMVDVSFNKLKGDFPEDSIEDLDDIKVICVEGNEKLSLKDVDDENLKIIKSSSVCKDKFLNVRAKITKEWQEYSEKQNMLRKSKSNEL